jgi:hypothetical protein
MEFLPRSLSGGCFSDGLSGPAKLWDLLVMSENLGFYQI